MLKRTLLLALISSSPTFATKTQFFRHGNAADFATGKLDSVVATNYGELKLARAVEPVLADDGSFASIDALAESPDGTIYAGTTASGKLLAIKDGKSTQIADFGEAASVAALMFNPAGDLLIGVGGDSAQLLVLHKGSTKPEVVVKLAGDAATYIWGVAIASDGKAYLATGPNGQLFEVDLAAKKARVIYDSDEDNLRAIVAMNDTLFVGTDPHGLILKVDRTTGKAFVVYDAPETEVSSLLIDAQSGQIYAGTSQLVEATEPPAADPDATPTGRPHADDGKGHIALDPSEPPKPSKPGEDEPAGALPGGEAKMPAAPEPEPTSQPAGDVGPPPAAKAAADLSGAQPAAGTAGDAAANGNAVYRIDAQGFVTEVFRAPVMIFGLAEQNNLLYLAAGPNGTVYQLDPNDEEHVEIAKTRAANLTSILATADGRLFLGSAGSAELSMLGAGMAKSGTFTSPVLDATQISAFGKAQVRGAMPEGTGITIATRSSNVSDEDSPLWSDWSKPVPAARFVTIATPAARYAQYRVTLSGDGKSTPTVDEVALAYQQPNIAPRVETVTIAAPAADATATATTPGEETPADPMRTITWTTTEPNGDALRYTLFTRSGPNQPWVTLAKDLTDVTYSWDTRRVADGRYEVKVEASDALANAPGTGKTASRVSDPILVDNTPPAIGDIKVTKANGKTSIDLRVADRGGMIASVEYAMDGDDHWQTVLPSDMLDDSPDEQFTIVLPDPATKEAGKEAGETRVVSLRARDENGNAAHESVTVRPEK